jgi:hypothetical protein
MYPMLMSLRRAIHRAGMSINGPFLLSPPSSELANFCRVTNPTRRSLSSNSCTSVYAQTRPETIFHVPSSAHPNSDSFALECIKSASDYRSHVISFAVKLVGTSFRLASHPVGLLVHESRHAGQVRLRPEDPSAFPGDNFRSPKHEVAYGNHMNHTTPSKLEKRLIYTGLSPVGHLALGRPR